MTDWVVESDWSKVNVGDRVRLENADGAVECPVVKVWADRDCWHIMSAFGDYAEWHWNLSVVPKPTPVLPTEPGIYRDKDHDVWLADPDGDWTSLTSSGGRAAYISGQSAVDYTPMTRLESQADTARKVLNALDYTSGRHLAQGETPTRTIADCDWDAIAAEFGVSL